MSRNTEANSSEAAQAKRREFAAHEKTDDLIAAAIAVRAMAYAPYSDHPVDAAVLDEQGRIHTGCNVENAASAMIAAGGRRIAVVAVAGPGPALCTPCGGCRQKIREFAGEATPVLVCGPEGLERSFTLGELLPASFGPGNR